MLRGYKIRLFPTPEQEEMFWKHIGSCRFIWNWMIAQQQERYKKGLSHMSGFDMARLLTILKNDGEHDWLYEVSNRSLQIICNDLALAYKRFFKKEAQYPKFKSKKRAKPVFPLRSEVIYFKDGCAVFQKIGSVQYKTNYNIKEGIRSNCKNARISYQNGKWILSFVMEREKQALQLTDRRMGIDLGVKETATIAFGDQKVVIHNINKSKMIKEHERKLRHLQRNVNRKYRMHKSYQKTKNIVKAEDKIRKQYARLSNIRMNYVHQSTHRIVMLLPQKIVMEDLCIKGMIKNRHLSKAILDQCLYEYIRQIRYKSEEYGIAFEQVDRFFPSSKLCSECGVIKKDLKLSDRVYVCDMCGLVIDRDYNAAINLMRYNS